MWLRLEIEINIYHGTESTVTLSGSRKNTLSDEKNLLSAVPHNHEPQWGRRSKKASELCADVNKASKRKSAVRLKTEIGYPLY